MADRKAVQEVLTDQRRDIGQHTGRRKGISRAPCISIAIVLSMHCLQTPLSGDAAPSDSSLPLG